MDWKDSVRLAPSDIAKKAIHVSGIPVIDLIP